MLSLRTLAAGFLAIMTGCQTRESEPAAAKPGPRTVAPKPVADSRRVAVFPYDEERDKYIFRTYDKKLNKYIFQNVAAASLSPSELIQAEVVLKRCIEDYNEKQGVTLSEWRKNHSLRVYTDRQVLINLTNYKRQLVAVINAKGEKEVWVNCFCGAYKTDQPREIVMVEDGGKYFLNVLLNIQQGTWLNLEINSNG
ncbi:hypothetical protein DDQ68_18005 [Hymenobacter nivis]|uniref:Lipoprotein n=2 Tax=Hymenobacter nivis TaxID=1850093 RepID=A0A2Z3GQ04_9BACT|nr:hypothetical protein DDQ68_18005 [Hymenobacter nivis]